MGVVEPCRPDLDLLPEAARAALAAGRPIVLGHPDAGALMVAPAGTVTAELVNFMATEARGLVALAIRPEHAARLGLSLQPRRHRAGAPLYTQSIEARSGISTGISAAERAHTIRVAGHPDATSEDVVTPGHIFPTLPHAAGPLDRTGFALLLLEAAGLFPAAATCDLLDDRGEPMAEAEAEAFAHRHGLAHVSARAAGLG